MSMLVGDQVTKEEIQAVLPKDTENNRIKILQNFAALSVRVPDAKHSKSRQKKILCAMQQEVKLENKTLKEQIEEVERMVQLQTEALERMELR